MNLTNETRWVCPNCNAQDVTYEADPHTRFHTCPGLKGLEAPLIREGMSVRIETHERDDYIGTDDVPLDGDGRPVMSLTVERDDGQDCVVYAGTAHARVEER